MPLTNPDVILSRDGAVRTFQAAMKLQPSKAVLRIAYEPGLTVPGFSPERSIVVGPMVDGAVCEVRPIDGRSNNGVITTIVIDTVDLTGLDVRDFTNNVQIKHVRDFGFHNGIICNASQQGMLLVNVARGRLLNNILSNNGTSANQDRNLYIQENCGRDMVLSGNVFNRGSSSVQCRSGGDVTGNVFNGDWLEWGIVRGNHEPKVGGVNGMILSNVFYNMGFWAVIIANATDVTFDYNIVFPPDGENPLDQKTIVIKLVGEPDEGGIGVKALTATGNIVYGKWNFSTYKIEPISPLVYSALQLGVTSPLTPPTKPDIDKWVQGALNGGWLKTHKIIDLLPGGAETTSTPDPVDQPPVDTTDWETKYEVQFQLAAGYIRQRNVLNDKVNLLRARLTDTNTDLETVRGAIAATLEQTK